MSSGVKRDVGELEFHVEGVKEFLAPGALLTALNAK